MKYPSQRRRPLSWLPSLRPSPDIREVDLLYSLPLTLFPYFAVNNQSLVDAAFRNRKPDASLSRRRAGPYPRFRSTVPSSSLGVVPGTRYLGECGQVIHEGAYLERQVCATDVDRVHVRLLVNMTNRKMTEDSFLIALVAEGTVINLYLQSGVKLCGVLEAFDLDTLFLRSMKLFPGQFNIAGGTAATVR